MIGLIFTIDCVKYFTERKEGTVMNLILTSKCVCQIFYTGIMSNLDSSYPCFLSEELEKCKKDTKCETASSIGCMNK